MSYNQGSNPKYPRQLCGTCQPTTADITYCTNTKSRDLLPRTAPGTRMISKGPRHWPQDNEPPQPARRTSSAAGIDGERKVHDSTRTPGSVHSVTTDNPTERIGDAQKVPTDQEISHIINHISALSPKAPMPQSGQSEHARQST